MFRYKHVLSGFIMGNLMRLLCVVSGNYFRFLSSEHQPHHRLRDLFQDLQEQGFWCYQSENWEDAYGYVEELTGVRFARKDELIPNVELIPINEASKTKFFEFSHPRKMRVQDFEFKVPPIEFEILHKELILRSPKDVADARHLRTLFSDTISEENVKKFRPVVRLELK